MMQETLYYGGVLIHKDGRRRIAPYHTPAHSQEQAVARARRWATVAFPAAIIEGAGMAPLPHYRFREDEPC